MATQKEIDNASKLTALTYMVAGCLGYSIENLLKYLDGVNLRLSGQEKMLLNRLKTQLSQVQTNLTTLEGLAFKVMATRMRMVNLLMKMPPIFIGLHF